MKYILLFSLMLLVGCNSNKSQVEDEPTVKCKDSNSAILNWRQACIADPALASINFNGAQRRGWCKCVEDNYHVHRWAKENCNYEKTQAWDISRLSEIQVRCGTIQKPL